MSRMLRTSILLFTLVLLAAGLQASASATDPVAKGHKAHTKFTSLHWPKASLTVNTAHQVRGVLHRDRAGRKVFLREFLPSSPSRVVDSTKSAADGSFALTMPTGWYHSALRFRVTVAKSKAATKAQSGYQAISVHPSYHPKGKSSWWSRVDKHRKWRLPACNSINWRINDYKAKPHALRDTKEAVRRLHVATGLVFHYLGRTHNDSQKVKKWPKHTNLVIAWLHDKDTKFSFKNHSGYGGPLSGTYLRGSEGKVAVTQKSRIFMDADAYVKNGFHEGHQQGYRVLARGLLLMHELGHVAGLGHVKQHPGQIMSYQKYTNWQAGDLGGLRHVGRGMGCFKPLHGRVSTTPLTGVVRP